MKKIIIFTKAQISAFTGGMADYLIMISLPNLSMCIMFCLLLLVEL
jgi:hypothetical protein